MMPNLRIAYFAGTMRPGHDGVTRVLYRLIDYLLDHRIDNVFFSPIVPSLEEQPTRMHQVPSVQFPLYKDYRFAMPGQRHFEDELNAFRPDILHINSPCSLGYAAVKYGQKHSIPVVATYHTHFPSYARYYKVKALETFSWNYFRKLYNGCERVFVPSEPILHELQGHELKTVEFLPHGVDTGTFHPGFRSTDWRRKVGAGSRKVLLFVGRLVWEKDLRILAETYQLLKGRRDDVLFVLVGDGPIRTDLGRMMPDAGFMGYQSGEELSTAYASSELFVFPSTTETFGNVTVEAMASGVPPICAREGGACGIVQHGSTGLLAAPRDAADLAMKIEYLLDHPDVRAQLADQALAYARTQTWERIFDRLVERYEDIVHRYPFRTDHRRRRAA